MRVEWVHPSWRDLVIDHLAASPDERRAFLEACELPGIELALSVGGGASGERTLPLFGADGDWDALADAVHRVCLDAGQSELARLLTALATALPTAPTERAQRELTGVAEMALETIARRIERSGAVWDAELVDRWLLVRGRLPGEGPPTPALEASLAALAPDDVHPRDLAAVARLDAYLALAEAAELDVTDYPMLSRFLDRVEDAGERAPGAVDPPLQRIARLVPGLRVRALRLLHDRAWASGSDELDVHVLPPAAADGRRVRRILLDL